MLTKPRAIGIDAHRILRSSAIDGGTRIAASAPTHFETFTSAFSDDAVRIPCACERAQDHVYRDWREASRESAVA